MTSRPTYLVVEPMLVMTAACTKVARRQGRSDAISSHSDGPPERTWPNTSTPTSATSRHHRRHIGLTWARATPTAAAEIMVIVAKIFTSLVGRCQNFFGGKGVRGFARRIIASVVLFSECDKPTTSASLLSEHDLVIVVCAVWGWFVPLW